jgi:hypothetical protein
MAEDSAAGEQDKVASRTAPIEHFEPHIRRHSDELLLGGTCQLTRPTSVNSRRLATRGKRSITTAVSWCATVELQSLGCLCHASSLDDKRTTGLEIGTQGAIGAATRCT